MGSFWGHHGIVPISGDFYSVAEQAEARYGPSCTGDAVKFSQLFQGLWELESLWVPKEGSSMAEGSWGDCGPGIVHSFSTGPGHLEPSRGHSRRSPAQGLHGSTAQRRLRMRCWACTCSDQNSTAVLGDGKTGLRSSCGF